MIVQITALKTLQQLANRRWTQPHCTDTDFKPRCLKATIEEELSAQSSVSYQRRGHDQLFAAKVPESRKVEGDVGEDHQVLDEGEQGVDWRDRADRSVYPSYSSDEESVFTPSP